MLSRRILLAIFLAVLQVVENAPLEEETPETVHLFSLCDQMKTPGKSHDKSPILLIHDITASYKDWDGVQQPLVVRTNRRVCAVDLRNHGNSAWSNHSDVEVMTADIMRFLDEKEIKKVNIVGHGLGGKIAVHSAINHPERVDSIVVEDMQPNGVTETASKMAEFFIRISREVISEVKETANYDEAQATLLTLIQKKLAEHGAHVLINKHFISIRRDDDDKWQWKANLDIMDREDIADILTPTTGVYEGPALFIYGSKSYFDVGDDRDNIMKMFPNAKLVEIEGAEHIIHGRFRQFQDEVVKFLDNEK